MDKSSASVSSYEVKEVKDLGDVGDVSGERWNDWDGILAASPGGGHVLQSYAWGEFKRKRDWRPLRVVLEKDGAEIAGAGQFLLYDTRPVPGYLMYAPKGPWLPWEESRAVEAFFGGVREIASQRGVHTVKIEPEISRHGSRAEEPHRTLESLGFTEARYDLNFADTITMDLSGSEEELLAGMSGKSTRYNVRLASRKGVAVYRPEDFEWAFETLYGWMQELAEHKVGYHITRPKEYFREVMWRMWEADQGRFFAAAHEGETIALAYFFNFSRKLWYMYSASSSHKQSLKPNYLLQWEAMRWAKSRGITFYDLVSVPPPGERTGDHPGYGVYRFKQGFGGGIQEFLGCMDLALEPKRAAAFAWYRLEPFYYRAYARLKGNIFY